MFEVFTDLVYRKDISLKAKGMYFYILSKASNTEWHIEDMRKELKEGKDSIYSALKELEDKNLLVREQVNNNGTYGGMIYHLSLGDNDDDRK